MNETDISGILSSLSQSDIEKLKKTAQSIFGSKPDNINETQKSGASQELSKLGFPDISVVSKLAPIISEFGKHDEKADFIAALKPMLSEERQKKADEAIRLMKLISVIPMLKNQGLM